jgi:Spy/CpxP family protein refolding chaperone
MKGNLAWLGALLLVALGACSAYGPAAHGDGYGMEPGQAQGMGRPQIASSTTTTMMGIGHLPSSLSAEQRVQVEEIGIDLRRRQLALMQEMHRTASVGPDAPPPFDEQAARRDVDLLAGLHRQLLENTIDARRRIDALLTPDQREEWRRAWAPR